MNDDEGSALAAEYTLGLLSPAEARAFEDLMVVDPDARADYAFWADHLARMTDDVAPVAPPEWIARKLARDLFGDGQEAAEGSRRRGWLERLGLVPAVAGGLIAAAAALWVIDVSFGDRLNGPMVMQEASARLVSEDSGLIVQVAYTDNAERLEITRESGAAPTGSVLQLWLLKADQPPISLGILPEDETGMLLVAEDIRPLLRGARCAISIELPGGSPTGQPTGDFVAEAPIVWET